LSFYDHESLAAVSATETRGALVEGFVGRLTAWRVSRSTIECDRQMTRGIETRLLVAAGA
jgi:hypothetical protein